MTKSTITREQLEEWVAQFDEDGGCDATDRQLEALIRQSLAAMNSEPVKRVNADQMHHVCLEANRHLDKYGAMAKEVNKLLGRIPAQPAPVVPDAATAIRACLSEFPESRHAAGWQPSGAIRLLPGAKQRQSGARRQLSGNS